MRLLGLSDSGNVHRRRLIINCTLLTCMTSFKSSRIVNSLWWVSILMLTWRHFTSTTFKCDVSDEKAPNEMQKLSDRKQQLFLVKFHFILHHKLSLLPQSSMNSCHSFHVPLSLYYLSIIIFIFCHKLKISCDVGKTFSLDERAENSPAKEKEHMSS